MKRWWWKVRFTARAIIFPLILLQFFRTLLLPTGFDVFILFVLFMFYLGFVFNHY